MLNKWKLVLYEACVIAHFTLLWLARLSCVPLNTLICVISSAFNRRKHVWSLDKVLLKSTSAHWNICEDSKSLEGHSARVNGLWKAGQGGWRYRTWAQRGYKVDGRMHCLLSDSSFIISCKISGKSRIVALTLMDMMWGWIFQGTFYVLYDGHFG